MKKQILFLAFLVLVLIIASNSNVTAQTNNPLQPSTNDELTAIPPECPAPTIVTCPSDAIHPVPGNPYTYSINVPSNLGEGATFHYRWFVTQDPNIITTNAQGVTSITTNVEASTGTGLFVQTADESYDNLTSGTPTISITWKSFVHDPEEPVFVVIYVEGEDGCLTNNVEIYEILPIHAFTLDIANMANNGTLPGDDYSTCVSPVLSAIYTGGSLSMNYGTNYLYYAVTAANFTDSWQPEFLVEGADGRTVTIEWQYPDLAITATGWHAATDPVLASGGDGATVGADGECIVVRVTIAHGNVPTLDDALITLAVDGTMNNPTTTARDFDVATYDDVHYDGCEADGMTNDRSTQTITPRPELITNTDGVNPPYPDPEPFEGKN